MPINLMNQPQFDLETKQEILSDWQRFVRGGFVRDDLSDILAAYLWWYGGLAYLNEMPEIDQFWWELFNAQASDLWRVIVQFGTQADPATDSQDWLMHPIVGDLNQALCAALAPFYESFLQVLDEFETERGLDLKAEAIAQEVRRLQARFPDMANEPLLTLALERNYDGVISTDGGIRVDEDLHARLSRAARVINGESRRLPADTSRPLTHPALFALAGQGLATPEDRQLVERNGLGRPGETDDLAARRDRLEKGGVHPRHRRTKSTSRRTGAISDDEGG